MRHLNLRITGILILAAAMLAGLNAQPQRFYDRPGLQDHRGWGRFHGQGEGLMAMLDLTEAQEEQINTLRVEHYNTMKPLRTKMGELKARERTLLAEEDVDMKAVDRLIEEQSELYGKIRKERVVHRMEMKEILTDEQIMKLEQGRKFMKHRKNPRGHFPHRSSFEGFPRRSS